MEGVKSSVTEEQKHRIFESEFLPQIDAMYNFAYRISYDEDIAKDLLQETYYKEFKFIESFHEGTNAKAWLFRILKNGFINEFRKKNKEPAMVDFQDVETYYNSDNVNEVITSDLRVEALQDMMPDTARYVTDEKRAKYVDILPLESSSVVLEIGCSLGQHTSLIAEKCSQVYALEVVKQQAAFTALRCRE